MFYCHLCKKHMWDANSFENHIKGRTHLMMREGIEESYRLKANMIRQEAKIAEQLKSIELDRLKRMGKTKQRQLEYCTMCDLNFHGHISAHRKSDGHLQLKKFLHPKCVECNKEFATRIDYDSHLLSADHLQKAAEKNTKVGERKRNTLTIITEEEELKDVRQPQKRKKIVKPPGVKGDENAEGEVKKELDEDGNPITTATGEGADAAGDDDDKRNATNDSTIGDDTKEGDDINDTMEEEDAMPPVDPEDCILDYIEGDDIPNEVDNRLPKYNWTRPVGNGLITKIECYECSLCGKFFDTEKTIEIHSRTVTHHRNFLKFINEKASDTKIAQKRAAAALEESERKKRKLEETEANNNGQEIKTENDDDDGNGEHAGDNGDLYDPSEATGDDDDVEMAENGNESNAIDDGNDNDYDDGVDDEMDAQEAGEGAIAEAEAAAVPEPEPQPTVAQTQNKTAANVAAQNKAAATAAAADTPTTTPMKTPIKAQATSTTAAANAAPSSQTPISTPTPTPSSTPTNVSSAGSGNNTPIQSQQVEPSPANKKGGPRGGGVGKGTPRGRGGRGRYNRY